MSDLSGQVRWEDLTDDLRICHHDNGNLLFIRNYPDQTETLFVTWEQLRTLVEEFRTSVVAPGDRLPLGVSHEGSMMQLSFYSNGVRLTVDDQQFDLLYLEIFALIGYLEEGCPFDIEL